MPTGTKIDGIPPDESQLLFDKVTGPLAQWPMWEMPQPYDWQMAILDACWNPGQYAIRTCNESGKTRVIIPLLAMSWAAAFKGSQVVLTNGSEAQGQLQLWPAMRRLARLKGYHENASQIQLPVVDPKIDASTITLRVTKNPEAFEGFHNNLYIDSKGREVFGPLLIIGDEGKAIKQGIWDAIGRCNPVTEVRISTTGEDTGGFYDACMNKSGLWVTSNTFRGKHYEFSIPWTMCPHLSTPGTTNYKKKKAILDERGPDDPYVASLLLAEFFRSGTHMAFDDSDLLAARRAMSGMHPKMRGSRSAFLDLSAGGDELTFGLREGNYIHPIVGWRRDTKVAPSVEADKYIRLFRQHNLRQDEISGDNGGYGAGIIRELALKGWHINAIDVNQKPKNTAGFCYRYDELHWEYKHLLQHDKLVMEPDEVLLTQMRKRRYVMKNTNDNKISMQSKPEARKKNHDPSPDRLDTIIGLIANMEPMEQIETANSASMCGTIKEYWLSKGNEDQRNDGQALMSDW